MNPVVRVLVGALVQFTLMFFAGWFAFKEDALGPDVHVVSRMGLVLVCLVAGILISELTKMRTHFGMMVGAMRAASAAGGPPTPEAVDALEAAATPGLAADPRAAVDILLGALSSDDAETRERAHRHLVRLTGKNLPPEPALWQRWWQENRDRFSSSEEP